MFLVSMSWSGFFYCKSNEFEATEDIEEFQTVMSTVSWLLILEFGKIEVAFFKRIDS